MIILIHSIHTIIDYVSHMLNKSFIFSADSSFECQQSDEPRFSNEITERTENFELGKKLSRGFTIKNILKSESHNANPLDDNYRDNCQNRNLDNSIMKK